MKYTAINIGPIIKTLGMARKPRELWAASYLFSYLMKCIVDQIPEEKLLSPAKVKGDSPKGVGLYPDRVFAVDIDAKTITESAKKSFFDVLKADEKIWDYYNIMYVDYQPQKDDEKESIAIEVLNNRLNILELCNYTKNVDCITAARTLLNVEKSVLLHKFFDSNEYETLGEIAAKELQKEVSEIQWSDFVNALKSKDNKDSAVAYKKLPKDKLKSYHKYICVVQADGDNVGKTVSHPQLENGNIKRLSDLLLKFGEDAADKIKKNGGFPIYAGGDDLLFIAPVVAKKDNGDTATIFDLIKDIDKSFEPVKKMVTGYRTSNGEPLKDKKGEAIVPSLSFGVSVSYYKYPLYEALESARLLLEDIAKDKYETGNLVGKNAIAFKLQKHSGSGFDIAFSKIHDEKNPFWTKLTTLINKTEDGNTVSAVAHKIRNNYDLVKMVLSSKNRQRLDAMFDKILECKGTSYFDAVKDIMPDVYEGIDNHSIYIEKIHGESDAEYEKSRYGYALYNVLRIAKFIKGEEAKDE